MYAIYGVLDLCAKFKNVFLLGILFIFFSISDHFFLLMSFT